MSAKYFVDTNILMYAHDKAAGAKHERAKSLVEELWRDRSGVVSTQVLQELSVTLRRKASRPLDSKATREIVADYLTWKVVVNGGESILEALDVEARYQISFWDALVASGPTHASCAEVLYSDLSVGQITDGARGKTRFRPPRDPCETFERVHRLASDLATEREVAFPARRGTKPGPEILDWSIDLLGFGRIHAQFGRPQALIICDVVTLQSVHRCCGVAGALLHGPPGGVTADAASGPARQPTWRIFRVLLRRPLTQAIGLRPTSLTVARSRLGSEQRLAT